MFKFDFDYVHSPDWQPEGCDIEPWFIADAGRVVGPDDFLRSSVCAYRTVKLDFIRDKLRGVDRVEALKSIVDHVTADAITEDERYRAIVSFIQRMMVHLMSEQPMEANAAELFRGYGGDPPVPQGEPYPEDLEKPWMRLAFEEARSTGAYLGLWCNPLGVALDGDWGIGGCVTDALELLMLHEGRCGHQAMVAVQLAQVAGLRARLVQINHHRVAEIMADGKWRLADPDALAPGFIGVDDDNEAASIEWCIENYEKLREWPLGISLNSVPGCDGYHWFFKLSD